MLNHQNEIDKRLEALSDKKETGIVLYKMSELESSQRRGSSRSGNQTRRERVGKKRMITVQPRSKTKTSITEKRTALKASNAAKAGRRERRTARRRHD